MKIIVPFITLTALFFGMLPAHAGGCYVDPVIEYSGSGSITSAVFLRDEACMDGSIVLGTVPSGASVSIIGFTDGWYRIEWNGARGWIGMQFAKNDASKTGKIWASYREYMDTLPSIKPGTSSPVSTPYTSDPTMLSRTRGYILLQVQSHGEAWYVDPVTEKRYYMKDGPTAYQMMRSFGLGVSEKDYAAMAGGNWTIKNRLRGRIILRVQEHGEAYYVHPHTLEMHYLKNGDEAYRVMRLYSLGITNADLGSIAEATIPLK
ncbi:SH3 domain-containing protein [Patescibacteria group bacterium]|jgi:hypothetical protein|uniref:SH3 domain-containing protein n=1 Tax=candidate division WWE3 bacterium TaxID=2053526 RepID=A0A928TSC1_UNCKA|nr:SH3 domain-containing protein [candidate division WWE3 bacterium]MCL4732858.1 SH3 domain-containing protein [Patescibacteria group bacterium]MDL1953037.1 SH3 domain-containing protein [Candidatus Uhrbacteria bacterium UHB]RIL00175.1 MAG: hypothetical protein DCC77_04805 [Candidatus Uhrbacteria bacterium]